MKGWLVSAALVWTAGHGAGAADAILTRNPTTGSGPFTLFKTSSRVTAAAGAEARLTWYFKDRLGVEGFARWSRPSLRTTITSDVESATGTESELSTTSYVYGGSVLFRLSDARLRPFVFAGVGQARQIEDGGASVTALEMHAGGGVERSLRRHFSVRADVAASTRGKAVSFDTTRKTQLVASVGFAYRFF